MKKFWFLLFIFSIRILNAQSYQEESLLFSRTDISGTARSIGSGGAYGSVGADLGSLAINPAGIGLYRSTDISITPGLSIVKNDAQFNGSATNTSTPRVYINQAGIVFTKIFKDAEKQNDFTFSPHRLKTFSFAINYQRQNMLGNTQNFNGFNNTNSGIAAYTDYLNATRLPFTTDNYPVEMLLASDEGLIGYDSISDTYYSNVNAPINQSGTITNKGGVDQIDLTFGGNVSDKFYFGAGMGFSILSFQSDAQFSELNSGITTNGFDNYTFTSNLRETGLGLNAKFGLIYRPIKWMRLGASYQIPTYYFLTENYQASMIANYDTFYYSEQAQSYPLKYKLRSPMKGTVSSSFYFNEHGFFSVDYEFLNYGSSRFNFGSAYKSTSDAVNESIKQTYGFGHVIRAGIEGSFKSLRIRAGYSYSTTPFKKDQFTKGFSEVRNNASIGIGYRGKRFYADFAYLFGIMKNDSQSYADFDVKNTNITHSMFLTLGWKINKEAARKEKSDFPVRDF